MRRRIAILCASLAGVFLVAGLVVWSASRFSEGSLLAGGAEAAKHPTTPTVVVPQSPQHSLAGSGSSLTTQQVQTLWDSVTRSGDEWGWTGWVIIADADTGEIIFEDGADEARTPASTMKLLTAFAALRSLNLEETLTTAVSQAGEDLYLWGEGDLLLAAGRGDAAEVNGRAGIADLADQVAKDLKAQGRTIVNLHVQGKLWDGPLRNSSWKEQEVENYAGDVGPFAIDTGRTYPGAWQFVPKSTAVVAVALSDALIERGIEVVATEQLTEELPGDARVIGEVKSATLLEQINYMLVQSDNTLAEQFCHFAAAANGVETVDFTTSTLDLARTLQQEGLSTEGSTFDDCSGLSEVSEVKPTLLMEALQASIKNTDGTASLTRMLPVAGANGTLSNRFSEGQAVANLTAKTGSLGSVTALAGLGTTSSGQNLFVVQGTSDVKDNAAYMFVEVFDDFLSALLEL